MDALAGHARLIGVTVVAVLVIVPLAFGTVYVVRHGGGEWVSAQYRAALSPSGPTNDVQRLASLGSSGRVSWYREALRGFSDHPVAGTGAGTFRFTNDLYRTSNLVAKHSHSQWLNVLTELGVVGLVLFAVAVGGLVAAAFGRRLWDRRDPHRALLAACQAAIIAFVVHLSLDWDWDMTAITIAFLLLAGVSAAYVRDRRPVARRAPASDPGRARRHRLSSAPAAGRVRRSISGRSSARHRRDRLRRRVLGACRTLPSARPSAAQDQLSRGQVASAEASARRATALDPLAVDPLLTLAATQAQQG